MAAFQSRSRDQTIFSPALFNFDHLEPHTQTHLKNVYSCLSVGMLSAALGAYTHFWLGVGQWYFLTSLASIGMIIWLMATRHTKSNIGMRMGIFTGFTFLSGISLGPLLDLVVRIEPSIVSNALAGTAVIFIGFTLAALLSRDRKFLYLGGFLFSGLSMLILIGLFSRLFGSSLGFDVYTFGILGLFSAFILYDTQLIIEKRRRGDDDFIWHSVDLFLDAIQIFRALMIILAKKEENKKKRRDN